METYVEYKHQCGLIGPNGLFLYSCNPKMCFHRGKCHSVLMRKYFACDCQKGFIGKYCELGMATTNNAPLHSSKMLCSYFGAR
uniref:EGF-like domain-containing protein n=1 Tax=Callorhinchus milii TaxID=7868 RepID=A0A4W3JTV5_CALMI